MKKLRGSIRLTFLLILLPMVLGIQMGEFLINLSDDTRSDYRHLQKHLQSNLDEVSSIISYPLWNVNLEWIGDLSSVFGKKSDFNGLSVFDEQDVLFYESANHKGVSENELKRKTENTANYELDSIRVVWTHLKHHYKKEIQKNLTFFTGSRTVYYTVDNVEYEIGKLYISYSDIEIVVRIHERINSFLISTIATMGMIILGVLLAYYLIIEKPLYLLTKKINEMGEVEDSTTSVVIKNYKNELDILTEKFSSIWKKQLQLITENRKQKKKLEKTARTARIGGWEYSYEEDRIFWSEVAKEIFGIDNNITDLETALSFLDGESRKKVERLIEKAIEERNGFSSIVEITTAAKKQKWIVFQCDFFCNDDGPKLHGLYQDITEKMAIIQEKESIETQLIHAQKMESVGRLAGGMAHDFNNVLGGILNASQLLQLPKQGLNEKSLKYVDLIIQASKRASDLISKLLVFSRKGNMGKSTNDIHEVLNDTADILKGTIDKKITISLTEEAQYQYFIGDFSAIESAFINLGINASHAMPDGGIIEIKTKNIYLDQKYCDSSSFEIEPGDFIQIEIKDTGTGIPEGNLQKIFDPFFTTKEQGKGTGLGLSVVYGTIQDHQGVIEVRSEVGKGTTFNILLPCSRQSTGQIDDMGPTKKGAGTVLLVDDEEFNRILINDILESLGYKVILAENGQEAVEVFGQKHTEIDIVLMDMIMPKMNGSEAFYKMKEIDENCKVIIASGYTKDEKIDTLVENGVKGFVKKPYEISEISRVLDKVIK